MATAAGSLETALGLIYRHRGLVLPVIAAALIFAVLVPIPPAMMNVLLIGNIALAAIILLTTIYVASPLEFSVFPSLLLGATLVRLVLNVATTRLILTAGAGGLAPGEAQYAAGEVIWAFSDFVTAGSLAVGVIIFTIIALIQFVVITKGAARISEVAARFVLDAMPGKQMAIDADLSAGLIDEVQAHSRRDQITRQADFYGAMDGASKFLRGDAIAAVLITMVNILGGLYIGMVQYGWNFSQTLELFTRLTIGDGLVTQIPAFIVSISAALIVTRSTARSNLGEEVIAQLTNKPAALIITAGFLVALTLTSMPKVPLILMGVGCVGLAWLLWRRDDSAHTSEASRSQRPDDAASVSVAPGLRSLLTVDPLRIELGYSLVPLVEDAEGGGLLERIGDLRKAVASQLGLLVPAAKICDDMALDRESYVVKIRGVKVGSGRIYPRKLLALADQEVTGEIAGISGGQTAFGTDAIWISRSQRDRAEMLNYTIVPPAAALATHLGELVRAHAAELLTRQQVAEMLAGASPRAADLVTEATEALSAGKIHKVLQNLLAESVPIRDIETILATMCDAAATTTDPDELTDLVRVSLGRMLTQQYCGEDGKLWCVSLAPSLAEEIRAQGEGDYEAVLAASPARSRRISEALSDGLGRLTRHGRKPVLLCDPKLRRPVRRLIAPVMPRAAVLGYNEVGSAELQSVGSVGIE